MILTEANQRRRLRDGQSRRVATHDLDAGAIYRKAACVRDFTNDRTAAREWNPHGTGQNLGYWHERAAHEVHCPSAQRSRSSGDRSERDLAVRARAAADWKRAQPSLGQHHVRVGHGNRARPVAIGDHGNHCSPRFELQRQLFVLAAGKRKTEQCRRHVGARAGAQIIAPREQPGDTCATQSVGQRAARRPQRRTGDHHRSPRRGLTVQVEHGHLQRCEAAQGERERTAHARARHRLIAGRGSFDRPRRRTQTSETGDSLGVSQGAERQGIRSVDEHGRLGDGRRVLVSDGDGQRLGRTQAERQRALLGAQQQRAGRPREAGRLREQPQASAG